MAVLTKKTSDRKILHVLVAGFVVVLLSTVFAGLVGIRNLRSINENANRIVEELRITSNLIAQVQRQLATQSAVIHRLSKAPEAIDNEKVLEMVRDANRNIANISARGGDAFEADLWRQLERASQAFSAEAEHSLGLADVPIAATRTLYSRHEELITAATALINLSYRRAVQAQTQIDRQSHRLIRETLYAVTLSLLVAVMLAVITLKLAARLILQREEQALELSRVSWHLLENQEETARRFSHELHDELGQSLTAVKANLAALEPNPREASEKVRDCIGLVDESIQNVREMSRLLHPRVLDDFGLDVALRALTERQARRPGVEIEYESNFERRLPLEIATHLYRVAQEALTNVAKHSHATHVKVRLWREGDLVTLSVLDNGTGLKEEARDGGAGLGLVAMAARARRIGGEFRLAGNPEGRGLLIEVRAPVEGEYENEQDPDTAG